MTREEAIRTLRKVQREVVRGSYIDEVYDMAIEALKSEQLDEWCTDCKEYDTEKKCCPRFNRVIRGAMKRIPHEDGTLEVKVADATKVGRVLISDDEHRGGLYYPDEYEPKSGDLISRAEAFMQARPEYLNPTQDGHEEYNKGWNDAISMYWDNLNDLPSADRPKDGDLISRAEAIEAIKIVDWYHQNSNKDMVHGANSDEHQAWYKAQDIYKALETVPSADRPRGEWLETAQDYYETVNKKGGGVNENTEYFTDDIACPNCLAKFSNIDNETERFNFCPNCGAEMITTKGEK